MKVIFLDNDGVICLANNWGSRYKKQKGYFTKDNPRDTYWKDKSLPLSIRFDNFDRKAVKTLNQILKETGAKIVVSSDWRLHATLEELNEYYREQGIIDGPHYFTEVFHYTDWKEDDFIPAEFSFDRTFNREQERYFEIKRWLRDHPEVTHWVAIDDLHMGVHVENSSYGAHDRDWGLENFVWTPRSNEGIKQSGVKEKLLKFLLE